MAALLVLLFAAAAQPHRRLPAGDPRRRGARPRSVGVRVLLGKGVVFVLAAVGCAMAGTLYLATNITFQPDSYFGVQLHRVHDLHGAGRRPRHVRGADRSAPSSSSSSTIASGTDYGVWYLVGLGAVAIVFALFLPRGIWGTIEDRFGIRLLPVGYRLRGIPTPGARTLDTDPEGGSGA